MPLMRGKSEKAFGHNVKAEMDAGKPQKQSLAIAYSMKRKGRKKMAEAGTVTKDDDSGATLGSTIGYPGSPKPKPSPVPLAEGGYADEDNSEEASGYLEMPHEHEAMNSMAHEQDELDLNQHGESDEGPMGSGSDDIVDRVMAKKYSEGGRVANDTPITAGLRPNQFDDLVLRDDLSSDYGHDDNAGDSLGNEQEDDDRDDIIERVMRMWAKKDSNPRPA